MNENNTLTLSEIARILFDHYRLRIDKINKLDLGADAVSQVFKVCPVSGIQSYFLKIRPNDIDQPGIDIPVYLSRLGIPHILSPIPTLNGQPALRYQSYYLILYPYLSGDNAMQKGMSPQQWTNLGSTIKAVHQVSLPVNLVKKLPVETFSPVFRTQTRNLMQRILTGEMDSGTGVALADCLRGHRSEIEYMLDSAEVLGQNLSQRVEIPMVPCHADLHKWNIFITDDAEIFVIDWDSMKFAPKECDLMYIGGNIGGNKADPNEIPCFYQGYSDTNIDREIIAYYRFERIIVDIAEFGKQVWAGFALPQTECEKIAGWIDGCFDPGCEYETACKSVVI